VPSLEKLAALLRHVWGKANRRALEDDLVD
jgi:hypothetical protein